MHKRLTTKNGRFEDERVKWKMYSSVENPSHPTVSNRTIAARVASRFLFCAG